MRRQKKVRFIPVYRDGKEHAGHADGYVVHPDDRAVRELPAPPEKQSDETPTNGEVKDGA